MIPAPSKEKPPPMETLPTAEAAMSCHVCSRKADVQCLDCNKPLCQQCLPCHNALMKDHQTVAFEDYELGQVPSEGRVCRFHNQQVRYLCETEKKLVCVDCTSLNICAPFHKRISLREAAQRRAVLLEALIKKCSEGQKQLEDVTAEADEVLQKLNQSVQQTKSTITYLKNQYIHEIETSFAEILCEVDKIQEKRVRNVEDMKKKIGLEIDKIKDGVNEASLVAYSKSELMTIYRYPAMSNNLTRLVKVDRRVTVNKSLGHLGFVSVPIEIPSPGCVIGKENWKFLRQFSIEQVKEACGIAVNYNGDIAVTSYQNAVTVFSNNGNMKFSFMKGLSKITDIAVNHDNVFVVANGNYCRGIEFHSNQGAYLSHIPVLDTSNTTSNLNSVAIDNNNQIISSLVQNTISIHNEHGTQMNKFATSSKPLRLAITSDGFIACSFRATSRVELMDYTGSNVRILQPPPGVTKWVPGDLCCRKGEILVMNMHPGNPTGVFRFTCSGQFLGSTTKEVNYPGGLALSHDGMILYVIETLGLVKIFKWE